MSVLLWVFGCVVGAVTWQAVFRLPGPIGRWLSSPFGKPSKATETLASLVAFLFLFILETIALHAVFTLFLSSSQHVDDAMRKSIGAIVFVSSIAGFFGFAILSQLLNALGSKQARIQNNSEDSAKELHPTRR